MFHTPTALPDLKPTTPMSTPTTPARRTEEEINHLKASWRHDPIWGIEHTEGFEAHREELATYSAEMNAKWAARAAERLATRRAEQRKVWGENAPDAALDYIHALEARLDAVEEKVSMIKPEALYRE